MISKGEKVGESDLVNNNRRIGTMQTQSQEVQLVSLHKEWYEMIIYEQNQKGNIKNSYKNSYIDVSDGLFW